MNKLLIVTAFVYLISGSASSTVEAQVQQNNETYITAIDKSSTVTTVVINTEAIRTDNLENKNDNREIECLALALYHEARGDGKDTRAWLSVANVIFNRTQLAAISYNRLRDGHARSVCNVVYERHGRHCQFSWVCHPNKVKEKELYRKIQSFAHAKYFAWKRGKLEDITKGSTHFADIHLHPFNPHTDPEIIATVVINPHRFYRITTQVAEKQD